MAVLETLLEQGTIMVCTNSRFDPENALILIPESADKSWRFTAVEAIESLLNCTYAGSMIIDLYIECADFPYIFRGNTIEECIRKVEDRYATHINDPAQKLEIEGGKEMKQFMLACIEISRLEDAGADAIDRASDDHIGWWPYYEMSDLRI